MHILKTKIYWITCHNCEFLIRKGTFKDFMYSVDGVDVDINDLKDFDLFTTLEEAEKHLKELEGK